MYDRVKIIIDAFERGVFEYGGCPKIDVNHDLKTYGLTDNELQIFKELFNYANPNELWNDLIYTDKEKYVELSNNLKTKQKVLDEQTDIKTGVELERSLNLVNTVEDILATLVKKEKCMVQKYEMI